jgi:hypothetical protein
MLAVLAAMAVGLIAPAGANAAVTVFVTPTPATLPAPGGNVQYTVNVNSSSAISDFCFDCIGGSVDSLVDSVYGDLNGKGTCSVSSVTPKPIPYACAFTAPVTGAAGTTVADLLTAGWVSGHTSPPPPPADPNVHGSAQGIGTVSLTAPVMQPPPTKCKKGFVLKKVKTKHGTKKKCVKKKKKK